MRRSLKELAFAVGGVGLGAVLFVVASGHAYLQGMFYQSWGYPLPWHYVGDMVIPNAFPIPGLNLGYVMWGAFYENLLFWLALPVLTVELSAHLAVPYVLRVLKLRRDKRTIAATSTYASVETSVSER